MYLKPVLRGLATWIPGARRIFARGTGGSGSARYCYSVWLRHLVMADHSGLSTDFRAVAELGPGDSLGTGLCAVLTGADRYLALDVVPHANLERNAAVLEELIDLLVRRAPIPDEVEFPKVDPRLSSYAFPGEILTGERLNRALAPDRLARIRSALRQGSSGEIEVRYVSGRVNSGAVELGQVDLVFSQAVLEHVEDLPQTYAAVSRWVRPGGLTSNCIDFRSHTYAREWNGHWGYSDAMWRLIRGNRPFLLNREPLSTHRRLLQQVGFVIAHEQSRRNSGGLPREGMAGPFRNLSDEDLSTETVFIQAVKSPG
jgi:hypothetical protein